MATAVIPEERENVNVNETAQALRRDHGRRRG